MMMMHTHSFSTLARVPRACCHARPLQVPEVEFSSYAALSRTFELRKALWKQVHEWQALQAATMTQDFRETVNAEELDKAVALISKEAFSFDKKVGNSITHLLREQTSAFKRIMPLVTDLGNPSIQPKHWQQIFDHIGFEGNPNASFTLQELKHQGIFQPECVEAHVYYAPLPPLPPLSGVIRHSVFV